MTFLPIVDRELRLAARRRSTYYIRMATALAALVIGGSVLLTGLMLRAMGAPSAFAAGAKMFEALGVCLWVVSSLAGLYQAADCLSAERREGTLGFLFLTDLKGYDVVLGKLLAVSLNAFYGLLAAFPILGLSIILGGITGGEVARICFTLANTLWFSITLALWVSSRSELAHRAVLQTLLWLVLLTFILPVFAAAFPRPAWLSVLGSVSPSEAFELAPAAKYAGRAGEFWSALALSNLAGWLFLGLASWRLPRFVEGQAAAQNAGSWRSILTGNPSFGSRRRQPALLEVNPVLWLMDDSPGLRRLVWALSGLGSALALACVALGDMSYLAAVYCVWPICFLLKLLFAVQSCRFFSEARRTGTLDLLCTTPLAAKTIYSGVWLSLKRQFFLPVVVLMSAAFLSVGVGCFHSRIQGNAGGFVFLFLWTAVLPLATSIVDFFAIGWFGLWLSLTGKKPQSAAGLTILFVILLPYFFPCLPTILSDVIFISVCKSKLDQDLRKLVSSAAAR